MRSKHSYLFLGLAFLLGVGLAFVYRPELQNSLASLSSNSSPSPSITTLVRSDEPGQMLPFEELTIPYLRAREYSSTLGTLTPHQETSTYTSYLTFFDSDGFKVNGLLTQPKGSMPEGGWPAIVFLHGYIPPSEYATTDRYEDYVDFLARNGFVVFKIDLRGHGNSEGEAFGAYYSSGYIIDTLNARAALSSTNFVHPEKIGLWGHSMSGNTVLRTMAAQPEITAGVIWAGAVYTYEDMTEYGIQDATYRRPNETSERSQQRTSLFDTHGRFSVESDFWGKVAATNYLTDLTGALQIHHAENDSVVDIRYSQNLDRLLTDAAVSHELHTYSQGEHNLSGATFSEAMNKTVDFFTSELE